MKHYILSPRARVFRALAEVSLLGLMLAVTAPWLTPPLRAVDRVWQTGGANSLWSTPSNWTPTGPPADGDSLFFAGPGETTINDRINLVVSRLSFDSGDWRITGNSLTISSAIIVHSGFSLPFHVTIDVPLGLSATLPVSIDLLSDMQFQRQIIGPGGIAKLGEGKLVLQSSNTFLGDVIVENGIVLARNKDAFGSTAGGVILRDGSVTLSNVIVSGETLFVRGTRPVTANTAGSLLTGHGLSGWHGRIELHTNLVVNSTDLCLIGGPVVGPGGFEFLGSRHSLSDGPILSDPSTFTGLTRVLCELLQVTEERAFRGPLVVGGGFGGQSEVRWDFPSLNRGAPEVTVHPNGLVNLNGRTETFTRLIMNGGRVITGSGGVSVGRLITNPTNVTATIEGTLGFASFPFTEFIVGDGSATPDLAISAVITDGINAVSIHKLGLGELRLSGANTYDGSTDVREGVLHIQHASSLGSTAAGTIVSDGATLQIEFVGALPEPLNIRGAGRGGTFGALNLMGATGVGADIVLAGPTTVRVDTSFAILSGAISGTGPFTKVGAGTLQFGGGSGAANTYAGDTLVEEGVLVPFKGTGVTTIPGHLIIGGGGGLFGASAIVRHFSGFTIGGSVTVTRGGLWDLNGNSESFSVAELQGRPPLTLNVGADVQTGAGTLTLPVGGDVVVDPGSFPGASSLIAGNLALDPGPHRFIVQSGVNVIGLERYDLDVSAVISQTSSAADIVKEGPGEMRLGAANSFTGPVTVNEGALGAAHAQALGTAAAGTFVNGNASLYIEGRIDVAQTLTLNSTNTAALVSLGPVTNVWSGNIILQRTAGIRVTDSRGGLTHSGIPGFGTPAPNISGPGGFTKSGPGALFVEGLSRGNSYTGPTTINDGLVEAVRGGRSLSSNIVVSGANSVLRTSRATGLFPARTVLPFGTSVTVQDGALWAMNGTNFETLSRLEGDGRLTVSTDGALTVTNSESCTFSGQFSGSGALNKYGLATFHVTGNSPGYTGAATVFDGTYKVDAQFLNSPVTVKTNSILRGNGDVGDVTVENGGVVQVDSDGQGRLGGELTMNSANFQSGSVLALAFFGPHPTGGNDHLFVDDAVTLTSPTLSADFQYPVRDGDVITLIDNNPGIVVSGAIIGFPEGAVRMIGDIPVVMSYVGGDGNNVTLTVTNLPLRGGGTQLLSGNGGSALVPNDCSQLWLGVTNRGAVAMTGLRGTLRSLTEGVVVTIGESSYPDLAPNARGTNATPFQIRTEPTFPCGGSAQFELVLTTANFPPTAIVYTMPGPSGFGLSLDGRDARAQAPVNAFPTVSNNFTIELWANPTGSRTQTAETNSGVSGVSVPLRQLQRFAVFPDRGDLAYGANHVGAGISIGVNGISTYEHGPNFLPSRLVYSNAVSGWTHVALVYASRRPRLYVNGALVRSSPAVTAQFIHASASLGGSTQGDFGNFRGQLDEVRIWNVALSETQIQANMRQSLTGTEAGLVTYFRCNEGTGNTLADSAPISPNFSGTLTDGAAFVLPGVTPFGPECTTSGGACESCFVVSGQFTGNTPSSAQRLYLSGTPSVCSPIKPCPGADPIVDLVPNLPPVRNVVHSFANNTTSELCVTARLRFGCSEPFGAVGAAAYLGEFNPDQMCANYLGDSGGGEEPFAFRVPAGSNFVVVVTARIDNLSCDIYTVEFFGLPCPPPTLNLTANASAGKVVAQWSSAYPDFRLQSANSLDGPGPHPFTTVSNPPVLLDGKYAVTNAVTAPRQFFRLEAR